MLDAMMIYVVILFVFFLFFFCFYKAILLLFQTVHYFWISIVEVTASCLV